MLSFLISCLIIRRGDATEPPEESPGDSGIVRDISLSRKRGKAEQKKINLTGWQSHEKL
jgi:hypothetical protein